MQLGIENFLSKLDNLATISPVAVELIHKLANIDTPREEITKLTESDEVIYTNLFKYMRSAALALPSYPTNTQQAIEVIGQYGLRNLIFIISARAVFLNLQLWQKSLLIAFLAKRIAEEHNYTQAKSSDIYIAALMCNFGQMLLKTFYPSEYSKIAEEITYTELLKNEKAIFGIDSLELSYEISKNYQLPSTIINLINGQRSISKKQNLTQENAIIYIAQLIAYNECMDYNDLEEAINKNLFELYNLDASKLNLNLLNNCKDLANSFN